jgi:hypothetical protein
MNIRSFIAKNKLLSLVIFLGSALTLLTVMPSGSRYCYQGLCGIYFWGAHEVDAVWHITLMNNAFTHFPFVNPIYSGAPLSGYNLFLDLILSLPVKLGVPADVLYFKMLPLIWLPLFIWITFKLLRVIKRDYLYSVFLFFFLFFGSTFMYMLDAYHGKGLLEMDSYGAALNLTNMQYSFSLVVMIGLMYVLQKLKDSIHKEVIVAILMFINTGLKFYAGLITGVFVAVYYLATFAKDHDLKKLVRSFTILIVFSIIAVVLVYDPFSALQQKEPILSFVPFAHSHVMIEDPGRLYLHNLVLARYTLLESGNIGPRLIAIEAFSVFLYLLFNFGTRIISLWTIAKKLITKKFSQLDVSITVSMFAGIIMVLFFVQRGQWWNTVQFFYYSLFFSSFFAAEFINDLLKKKNIIKLTLVGIIILFTLPFNFAVIRSFSQMPRASSFISDEELKALEFLRRQPSGIVASTKPQRANPSAFAHTYQKDTAYISAYSHKVAYFESEVFLQLLGIDYKSRKEKIYAMNPQLFNDVNYIYVHNVVGLKKRPKELERIFRNKEITIYKVNH